MNDQKDTNQPERKDVRIELPPLHMGLIFNGKKKQKGGETQEN